MRKDDGAGMDIKAILGGLAFAFMWSSAFTSARIIVTNYEMMERFDPDEFAGVVIDESSILKSFDGKTRNAIKE